MYWDNSVALFQRLVIAAGTIVADEAILWRQSHAEQLVLPTHQETISSPAFPPDGETPAPLGVDGTAKLWDAATGKMRSELACKLSFSRGARPSSARLRPCFVTAIDLTESVEHA